MTWKQDIEKHAPPFSEADEWEAQEQGYGSALDKWTADMDWKSWTHQAESVTKRGKAQAESDLHSVNCPYDRLGALSDAASRLPGIPDYTEPEPQPTRDPVTRAARIHGMTRFIQKTMRRVEEKGIPWRTALQGAHATSPETSNLKAEWENVRERLAVLGEDLDKLAEDIASGDIHVTDAFEAEIAPDDPELRRVYRAQEKDCEVAHAPEDDDAQGTDGHAWLPERNEGSEVEFDPVRNGGPNGHADEPRWTEQDIWDDSDVYNGWSEEDE